MFCCLKTAPKDYCLNSFNSFNFFNSSIPLSDKEHDDDLGDDDSDKHAERINRSIADTRRIAIQGLVGVG